MTHTDLREQLQQAAHTITPSPAAPLRDIEMRARRRRTQRRTACGVGAAVMSVAAVAFAGALGSPPPRPEPAPATGTCQQVVTVVQEGNDTDLQLVTADCSTTGLADGPHHDMQPSMSPDGRYVAFTRNDDAGALMLLNRDTGELVELDRAANGLGNPAISPDATRVAYWRNDAGHPYIYVVPLTGGTPTRVTTGEVNEAWPTWSTDSRAVVFARPPDLVVVDVETGEEGVLHQAPKGLKYPFFATNNGRPILAVEEVGGEKNFTFRLVRLDPESGAAQGRSEAFSGRFLDATWDGFGIHVALTEDGKASTIHTLDYNFGEQHTATVEGLVSLIDQQPEGPAIQGTTLDGRTYGTALGSGPEPDLVATQGGYVLSDDVVDGPMPANPTQALRWSRNGRTHFIPEYATDGVTVVGLFSTTGPAAEVKLTTTTSAPPGTMNRTEDGTVVVRDGCTLWSTGGVERWLIWPVGYFVTDEGVVADADGRDVAPLGEQVTLTVSELPGQRAEAPCADDRAPLYVMSD